MFDVEVKKKIDLLFSLISHTSYPCKMCRLIYVYGEDAKGVSYINDWWSKSVLLGAEILLLPVLIAKPCQLFSHWQKHFSFSIAYTTLLYTIFKRAYQRNYLIELIDKSHT